MEHVFLTGCNQQCLWQGTHTKPINDLQFTRHMIHYMLENYCIDNDRLYASGFDIGGGFIDNLACSGPEHALFAAYAMVSPLLYTNLLYPENEKRHCKPWQAHPILESEHALLNLMTISLMSTVHGAHDEANCCTGGETKGEAGLSPYHPGPDFLKRWAKRDGCNRAPDTCTKHGGLVETTSYTCQGKEGFVQGIKVGGQKYGWPSTEGNQEGQVAAVDASKKIIEFFEGHCKGHCKGHA